MRSSRFSGFNSGKVDGAIGAPGKRAAHADVGVNAGKRPGWLCEPESVGWRDDAAELLAVSGPARSQIRLEADLRFVRAL